MFEGLYRLGTFYTLVRARNLYQLEPFLSVSGPCVFQKDEVRRYGELAVVYLQFNLHCLPLHRFLGLLPFIFHYLDMLRCRVAFNGDKLFYSVTPEEQLGRSASTDNLYSSPL